MKVPELLDGLFALDRASEVPLNQQIYRAVRAAVSDGYLKAGMRLPSSRALADRLGVSRNTINAALDLLQAESIIAVAPGRAPCVARTAPPDGLAKALSSADRQDRRLSARGLLMQENLRGDGWASEYGALQPGAPALDLFPHDLWGRYLRRAARKAPGAELLYENYVGHPSLTSVLAEYLASERGVLVEPHQIIVTSSMQASLSGLAAALADPGDMAWIEDPGYLGARTAFHGAGLRMRGIPVDEQGANIIRMEIGDVLPKLVYVTPSHQYPFGTRMTLARRLALVEAVRSMGGMILEDDYDSEFLFEGRPVAALQGLAGAGEVIYLGTFAKSFLPGVRISYCVVPDALVDGLRRVFRQSGRVANVHAQIALADFIISGEYRAHLKRIRQEYQRRGEMLVERLQARLANRVEVSMPTGNVQLAVKLREQIDDVRLAQDLQRQGFAVSPLSPCFLDRVAQPGLIVGFAAATSRQVDAFSELLGTLVSEQAAGDKREERSPLLDLPGNPT